jgi:glycosyltransferase involved in cell wall biosynthesis
MTISVIIPLYNKKPHIERALSSVLSQSYSDLNVIVVDDGSTDGGGDVARGVRDNRVRVVSTANCGVSAARNRGLQLANTELVAFLDADDEWLPRFLHTVVRMVERFPAAALYATAYELVDFNGVPRLPLFRGLPNEPQGGLIRDYWLAARNREPVISSNVLARKSVLDRLHGFPEQLVNLEDLVTWMRVALRYPIAWSPAPEVVWHQDAVNRCASWIPVGIPPLSACLTQYLREETSRSGSIGSAREYVAKYDLSFVMNNLLAGRKAEAMALLRRCRKTRVYRLRWLLYGALSVLPVQLIRVMWSAYGLRHGNYRPVLPVKGIYRASLSAENHLPNRHIGLEREDNSEVTPARTNSNTANDSPEMG